MILVVRTELQGFYMISVYVSPFSHARSFSFHALSLWCLEVIKAPASVAQSVGMLPVTKRLRFSSYSRGTCDSLSGCIQKTTNRHFFLSLPVSKSNEKNVLRWQFLKKEETVIKATRSDTRWQSESRENRACHGMPWTTPRPRLPWGRLYSATHFLQTWLRAGKLISLSLDHKYKSRGRAVLERWKCTIGVRASFGKNRGEECIGLSASKRGTVTAFLENSETPAGVLVSTAAGAPGPEGLVYKHLPVDCWMSTWGGFGDPTTCLCPCPALSSLMDQGLTGNLPAQWGTAVIVQSGSLPFTPKGWEGVCLLEMEDVTEDLTRANGHANQLVLWALDTFENVMRALFPLSKEVGWVCIIILGVSLSLRPIPFCPMLTLD